MYNPASSLAADDMVKLVIEVCCLTEEPFVQVIVGLGLPVATHNSVIVLPSSTVTVRGDFSVILGATED